MGDFAQRAQIQCDVIAQRRGAEIKLGAVAAGDERQLFGRGEANDFGGLLSGLGFCCRSGRNAVDRILRQGLWLRDYSRSVHHGFQPQAACRRGRCHERSSSENGGRQCHEKSPRQISGDVASQIFMPSSQG